jgi:catechol 2,3-dioxygenase-like lactoylglutathione lyase family enzyme
MRNLCALLAILLCASAVQSQQRPRITGIAQVRLYTATPEPSNDFYGRTLGLERTTMGAASVYTVNSLQSIEVEPLPSPEPRSRLAAVVLRTSNAAAMEHYLRAHAVTIDQPLSHGTFGVHDPEGYSILFTQSLTGIGHTSPKETAHRIIHAGFVVKDRAAEDRFYREILGFHIYWQGGQKDGQLDYMALQVPDGSDWLEYMLSPNAGANAKQLGGSNHLSLGVTHMSDAIAALQRNHCEGPNCTKSQLGRDGKTQLNLFDPDLTRVEYMEYTPVATPCCSPILGKAPGEKEDQ